MPTKMLEGRLRGIVTDYVTVWYSDGTSQSWEEPGTLKHWFIIRCY